jgi:hypothetical protein
MDSSFDKALNFLTSILSKPGMFGINRVEDINLMILGYSFASVDNELSEMMIEFTDFVNNNFEFTESFGWVKLIRLYSGSDSHSIQLFAEIFKRFLKEKHNIEIA